MAHDSSTWVTLSSCLSDDEMVAFAAGRLPPKRLRAAHRHLDQCETCQQLLNEAVHALAMAATAGFSDCDDDSDALAWNAAFRPGTTVGKRYVIVRFIARGGMGEVYEAFDQELQERVALKTVTATACDNPNAVRRLKAEVQLARRVSHPNVCRIYDFGTHTVAGTSAQLSFLTMEFVSGETLRQRVQRQGPLPVAEARRIGLELLGGLRAAHDAGILHRDFKSDNVMLRQDGDRVCPVILDFGLARPLNDAPQSHSSQRSLIGTFAYIAPEQLEGKPHSPASDVYSFGLVWFEMLTGELPFPPAATLDRLTRPPPAPSSRNAAVDAELDSIVLKCLRRDAEARPATAAAVLTELDAARVRPRARRSRRLPRLAAGLCFLVALLALGALAVKGLRNRASTVRSTTPGALRILTERDVRSDGRTTLEGAVVKQAFRDSRPEASISPPPPPSASSPSAPKATPSPAPEAQKEARAKRDATALLRPPPSPSASAPAPASAGSGWENPFSSHGRAGSRP